MRKSNLVKSLLVLITTSIVFSCCLPVVYSNEVGVFDGLYVKHTYGISMDTEEFPSTLTWTNVSNDIFEVEWELGGSIDDTGSWEVNINTRVVFSMRNFGPDSASHDFCWIYTDVSLNDQLSLFNFFKNGDNIFNITGESTYGSMAVWVLEDNYGSVVWFEKTKGFLVNGTFRYNSDWQTYEFVETNAFGSSGDTGDGAIPGFNYLFLIGIIAGVSFMLIKKQKIKK